MADFSFDPRLADDTLPVRELALCSLRLLNDSRWPWLVLVPRISGACEMHDLSEADTQVLISETVLVGRMLKVLTGCEKVNTATIGNIVRQLHVHVIARSQGDANWPGPVWGYGTKTLYSETAYGTLIKRIQRYDL